ncbi:MAG: hypothetical protein JST86_14155 [Bacteroidetes bacterium]|nr:hypothetical protein [Bacteroidota bacterium]
MKYKLTVWNKVNKIGLSTIHQNKTALLLKLAYLRLFKGVVRYEIKEIKDKNPLNNQANHP